MFYGAVDYGLYMKTKPGLNRCLRSKVTVWLGLDVSSLNCEGDVITVFFQGSCKCNLLFSVSSFNKVSES